MEDLERAKKLQQETGATCVVCRGDRICRTQLRGVRPLLDWLDEGADMMGWSACDKVVGKGAAFLYCLLGVRRVHGRVMSVAAVKVFRAGCVEASWDILAERIMNRKKDGPCPIETACAPIDEPEEALPVIRKTLENLM